MRGSGLEGKNFYIKYFNKNWFPYQTAFYEFSSTFIEHLYSVQLCELEKDETQLRRSTHNIVRHTHTII